MVFEFEVPLRKEDMYKVQERKGKLARIAGRDTFKDELKFESFPLSLDGIGILQEKPVLSVMELNTSLLGAEEAEDKFRRQVQQIWVSQRVIDNVYATFKSD